MILYFGQERNAYDAWNLNLLRYVTQHFQTCAHDDICSLQIFFLILIWSANVRNILFHHEFHCKHATHFEDWHEITINSYIHIYLCILRRIYSPDLTVFCSGLLLTNWSTSCVPKVNLTWNNLFQNSLPSPIFYIHVKFSLCVVIVYSVSL